MLLPACDGPLDGIDEPCVHAHKPIARPFTDDFVAGLAGRGGELATSVAWLLMALVVWHAGNSLQDPQRTPADGSLARR